MNTLLHTLHQHWLALRIWWRCKRDPRTAGHVVYLLSVLRQEADTDLAYDRPY
jgi:hypothetical protein